MHRYYAPHRVTYLDRQKQTLKSVIRQWVEEGETPKRSFQKAAEEIMQERYGSTYLPVLLDCIYDCEYTFGRQDRSKQRLEEIVAYIATQYAYLNLKPRMSTNMVRLMFNKQALDCAREIIEKLGIDDDHPQPKKAILAMLDDSAYAGISNTMKETIASVIRPQWMMAGGVWPEERLKKLSS